MEKYNVNIRINIEKYDLRTWGTKRVNVFTDNAETTYAVSVLRQIQNEILSNWKDAVREICQMYPNCYMHEPKIFDAEETDTFSFSLRGYVLCPDLTEQFEITGDLREAMQKARLEKRVLFTRGKYVIYYIDYANLEVNKEPEDEFAEDKFVEE